MTRARGAHEQATRLGEGHAAAPRRPTAPRRTVSIGDPQTSAAHFFAILESKDLLGEDGFLRPDVQLVSMGDHFDYAWKAPQTLADVQRDGVDVLAWLAAHAPEQVAVVLGNHDVSRVTELAHVTDAAFAAARLLASELSKAKKQDRAAYLARVRSEWVKHDLPAPGLVDRDYSSFTEAQRRLVTQLLLDGRFSLALTARLDGRPALLSHAGVTDTQLGRLEVPADATASTLAGRLQDFLIAAVAEVRDRWTAGRTAALSLAPLHHAGATALDAHDDLPEGGGLLYHRPHDPDREDADDRAWEAEGDAPRRFHPKALPIGLVQIAGHSGHEKCWKELPRWREDGMTSEPGGLRTLSHRDGEVRYRRGIVEARPGEAVLYLIDPEMNKTADPTQVPVLELDAGSLGR